MTYIFLLQDAETLIDFVGSESDLISPISWSIGLCQGLQTSCATRMVHQVIVLLDMDTLSRAVFLFSFSSLLYKTENNTITLSTWMYSYIMATTLPEVGGGLDIGNKLAYICRLIRFHCLASNNIPPSQSWLSSSHLQMYSTVIPL